MAELDIQGILGELVRDSVDFLVINWVLLTKLGRLDVMQWIGDDPLWDKLSPAAVEDRIGDLPVKFVSYEDLVALKEQAARPEDLTDLERLRQARGD